MSVSWCVYNGLRNDRDKYVGHISKDPNTDAKAGI